MTAETNALVQKTCCLLVEFSKPGITRKLAREQYEAEDADKLLIGASKKIVDAPEFTNIRDFAGSVRRWIASNSLPSRLYRSSTFLIPVASVKKVDEYLTKAREEWTEKVEAYVAVYNQRFDETLARLGGVGSESDRMTLEELRAEFGFHHEWVTLSTPSTLKEISAAMFEAEERKLAERLKSAEGEIVAAYREQFAEMVASMAAMLDPNPGTGPKKFFFGSRVGRLQTFIDDFTTKNVCGDAELEKLMKQASGLLAGVDPKDLKNDAQWRTAMQLSFSELQKTLSKMVAPKGKRLITDIDEERVA